MRIESLREFVALADCGNYTKAAARLYISQPALSKHMAQLEDEVGHQLLERDTKAVSLTPLGRVFKDYALELLGTYDVMTRTLDELSRQKSSKVVFKCYRPYRPIDDAVRMVRRELKRTHPLLLIDFLAITDCSPVDELVEGHIDACVVGAIPAYFENEALRAVHLYLDPLVAIVERTNPLAQLGRPLRSSDFNGRPVWIPDTPAFFDVYGEVRRLLAMDSMPDFRFNHRVVDVEGLFDMDFEGGAFVTNRYAASANLPPAQRDTYSMVPFEDPGMSFDVCLLLRADDADPALMAFAQTLEHIITCTDMGFYAGA